MGLSDSVSFPSKMSCLTLRRVCKSCRYDVKIKEYRALALFHVEL